MFYLYFYIISSAFRRLQDKTQVFPLDKSDFVRTRLTHSVEVSTIARQLGIMITRNNTKYLPPEFKENKYNEVEKIPSILSCAGLLHDIGNPPFGHFGEVVIGDWFQKELEKDNFIYKGKSIKNVLNEQMRKDLCHFEGNAQALRILSKISNKEVSHEINLTKGVISALINQGYDVDKAKLLIGDLEKRIEKAENNNIECIEEAYMIALQNWMDYARQWFMYCVAYSFSKNYQEIMRGTYNKELISNTFHEASMEILKSAMKKFVYIDSEIVKLELSADKMLSALLNDFIYAVIYFDEKDETCKQTQKAKKLCGLLPENLREDYFHAKKEDDAFNLYLRFLMVTDFISGMTDSYAKNLYQELNGIR